MHPILGVLASSRLTKVSPPISGYSLWLDGADDTVFSYSSGTLVSQWNDKSGNGYNFIQPTVANQPNRNQTQNSLPSLLFRVDWMYNTSLNWANSAHTVFVVIRYDTAAYNYTTVMGSNNTTGYGLGIPINDNYAIYHNGVAPYDYNLFVTGSNADVAIWKSAGVSSGNVTTSFRRNTTNASATQSISGVSLGTGCVVGAAASTGGDATPDIDAVFISEVLIYPSQLSDADRDLVQGYLKTKWNTPA